MTVEAITSGAASTISDLDSSLPAGSDFKSEGDNHIRNTKKALQLTFPNISATVSGVASELAFAHKGGTVSGIAFIKGKVDCASLSVSGTAIINDRLICEDAAIAGSLTVSGAAVFVSNVGFEKTVSISHVIARNTHVGRFQALGTTVYRNSLDLSCLYVSSGIYTISHAFDTLGYAAVVNIEGSTTGAHATVRLHSLTANTFGVEVRNQFTGVNSNLPIHVMVHKG